MVTTVKITKRDRYSEIIACLTAAGASADLITFCEAEIAALDKKSVKAKEAAAAKKTEADPLQTAIQEAMGTLTEGEYATIADITAMVAGEDAEITPARVQYRLTQLIKTGAVESTDVKVPATETTKARTVKGYRICVAD